MMVKRGYSNVFAGGVEAAASSGGSIMPPIMGIAAFVLASLTVVPYSQVIIAAIIPAVAYFFCLFLSAVFQARKQNIKAIGKLTDDMRMSRQDIFNLAMIFGPILLILSLLLATKDTVGCGVLGGFLGADGSIGFQLIALFVTMFIAILLGMGMPAVPAYINVALLMGPVLAGLGIATFTAHMFIF